MPMNGGMRSSLDDELATIAEEDGESVRSGATNKSKSAPNGGEDDADGKKEKKKKKKGKVKDSAPSYTYTSEDHDTAQQILVDLCTEMKELKNSMQQGQEAAGAAMTSTLDSNERVIRSLADQMDMMRGNMRQLDQVIESRATPEQIEELARIRAVQEMMKVVTDDKERTVGVYEAHARRGYEEIERLRQDLAAERKETAALRQDLEAVRGDRHRMMVSGPPTPHLGGGGDGGSIGSAASGKGGMLINGGVVKMGKYGMSPGGDFDDMTLETKGSYDTTTYEMKSLKKRIIHMKKKLTIAQMEAKETGELRSEVERLRIECETQKKASAAKDETIRKLEKEIEVLKRAKGGTAAGSSARPVVTPPSGTRSTGMPARSASTHVRPTSTPLRTTTSTAKPASSTAKKSKWWHGL